MLLEAHNSYMPEAPHGAVLQEDSLCCLLRRPLQGVAEWLDTLGRFNVPCALVSALDRATVQVGVQIHWSTAGTALWNSIPLIS